MDIKAGHRISQIKHISAHIALLLYSANPYRLIIILSTADCTVQWKRKLTQADKKMATDFLSVTILSCRIF